MAEASPADSPDDLLLCSICLEEYKDPRVLSCHHTFCYNCISAHANGTASEDGTFECPFCRKEVQIPTGGLGKLTKDFRISKIKDCLSPRHQREVSIQTEETDAMSGHVAVQSQPPLAGQEANPTPAPYAPVFIQKVECMRSFSARLEDDKRNVNITGLATDKQYVYIVDIGNNRTKVFKHAGQLKFDIERSKPFDVAVSQSGTSSLYITSHGDKCVNVYSTSGHLVTTMGQGLLDRPCGITLNKQGHVMVCDSKKNFIYTFFAVGGYLRDTIPARGSELRYISVNRVEDNIVLSDREEHCVHVLLPCGQLVQYGTYGSGDGQLCEPRGVCTDSYGHVFIADRNNNRIVALSPQGQFIRNIVTEEDGLEQPTALDINPAGHLVVAEKQGNIKTFQYLQ